MPDSETPDVLQATDNMAVWNAVSRTDPKHTRPVTYGTRKFTAIDAMWQIMRATEMFGPIGTGWGYEVVFTVQALRTPPRMKGQNVVADGGDVLMQFADVTVWYMMGGTRRQYGPQRGCNLLCNANGALDEDAPKKAVTDALTKALSHLGFSADVFLGLYDDNRYVQNVKREFRDEKTAQGRSKPVEDPGPPPSDSGVPASLAALIEDMRKATSLIELASHYKKNAEMILKLGEAELAWTRLQYIRHGEVNIGIPNNLAMMLESMRKVTAELELNRHYNANKLVIEKAPTDQRDWMRLQYGWRKDWIFNQKPAQREEEPPPPEEDR